MVFVFVEFMSRLCIYSLAGLHHAAIGMAACCRPSPQTTGRAVAMRRGNFLPRAHPNLMARISPLYDF